MEPIRRVDQIERCAIWGHPSAYHRPVMGRLADTFPLDWGWKWGDSEECHHLSELTIKRLTKGFTHLLTVGTKRASAPPNVESAWEQRLAGKLAFPVPWKEIWKSKGTFLTTPKDENTYRPDRGIAHSPSSRAACAEAIRRPCFTSSLAGESEKCRTPSRRYSKLLE